LVAGNRPETRSDSIDRYGCVGDRSGGAMADAKVKVRLHCSWRRSDTRRPTVQHTAPARRPLGGREGREPHTGEASRADSGEGGREGGSAGGAGPCGQPDQPQGPRAGGPPQPHSPGVHRPTPHARRPTEASRPGARHPPHSAQGAHTGRREKHEGVVGGVHGYCPLPYSTVRKIDVTRAAQE